MSGGSFDYAYHHMQEFSDRLKNRLEDRDVVWDDPAVISKLCDIAELVSRAARLAKEVEWLYSADTGEDTFLRRVAEIEK